ncbi:hypothetical protein PG997_013665 [Apiospora hydei]|uniref:Uncharacterized protein n=1 Tax=Apiospora hydei TaxID=1337664 RepID=A0ABR1VAD2_9PEZI
MAKRILTAVAVLAALLAAFLAALGGRTGSESEVAIDYLPGKNNTVLFLTNSEYGLSNVHVATAQSLIERHPHVRVHFASFPSMASRIARVCSLARVQNPSAPNITFHELKGQSYAKAVEQKAGFMNLSSRWFEHGPGLQAYPKMATMIQGIIAPWDSDAYLALYEEVQELIQMVDPAVVVLEILLNPATDATRNANRRHVFINPGSLSDQLAFEQPHGKGFWKYPCMSSDIPFPVPWHRIPENVFLVTRFIYSVFIVPQWRGYNSQLKEFGIPSTPILRDGRGLYMSPHIPGATLPLDVISKNTMGTNSIVLRSATAVQQDPELASWLERAPTLLINLGSVYKYTEESAKSMAQAIQVVLAQTKVSGTFIAFLRPRCYQVLWKHCPDYEYGDDFKAPWKVMWPRIGYGSLR